MGGMFGFLIPISIVLFYLLFTVPALGWLSRRRLEQLPQAIWAWIVLSVPIMGAVALVLVKPGEPGRHES